MEGFVGAFRPTLPEPALEAPEALEAPALEAPLPPFFFGEGADEAEEEAPPPAGVGAGEVGDRYFGTSAGRVEIWGLLVNSTKLRASAQRRKNSSTAAGSSSPPADLKKAPPREEPPFRRAKHSSETTSAAASFLGLVVANLSSSFTFHTVVSTATARTARLVSSNGVRVLRAFARDNAVLKPTTMQARLLAQNCLKRSWPSMRSTEAARCGPAFRLTCQALTAPCKSNTAGGSPLATAKVTGGLGKSNLCARVFPVGIRCQQSTTPKLAMLLNSCAASATTAGTCESSGSGDRESAQCSTQG
mmetsp:Transcript_94678/g.304742  ORF Transcript_94678/g.304742 Transcript_94678/m.304742 type:complete len:303 (+) Transcript_94678:257-1165(+)